MAIAALGVVFGDIGISPLYTLKACFAIAAVTTTFENTLGIISLLAWTLIIVVCIKYVARHPADRKNVRPDHDRMVQ